ncbi:MAG TPA: dTDP-4-dehydrorhamnose 3,5-epimerase [Actinomycetota bacterium]|nr:dTDP-4-dehydrorhamnose 3,5-epimerase [Actinomycetota bacterium]
MIFTETGLRGAFVVDLEPIADDRGFFARSFDQKEFAGHGLAPSFVQCNVSQNRRRGTLRGMHWQAAPYEEGKLVRCVRGAIHDVIVDLRPESPTLGEHVAVTLTAANRTMLYVPEGFAHGFLTLADDTEVFYQISAFHAPGHARGARWDDPQLGIDWPAEVAVVSERDRAWPDLRLGRGGGA